jgi:hypothetical protein
LLKCSYGGSIAPRKIKYKNMSPTKENLCIGMKCNN